MSARRESATVANGRNSPIGRGISPTLQHPSHRHRCIRPPLVGVTLFGQPRGNLAQAQPRPQFSSERLLEMCPTPPHRPRRRRAAVALSAACSTGRRERRHKQAGLPARLARPAPSNAARFSGAARLRRPFSPSALFAGPSRRIVQPPARFASAPAMRSNLLPKISD